MNGPAPRVQDRQTTLERNEMATANGKQGRTTYLSGVWRPASGAYALLLVALLLVCVVNLRSAGAVVVSPEFKIADEGEDKFLPAISGKWVVWQDTSNGNSDIFARDISDLASSPPAVQITTGQGEEINPAISGSVVVWEELRNGDWDIFGYDLLDQRRFPVSAARGDQRRPAISGNQVVWEDNRRGNWDIFVRNLDTGQGRRITRNTADQRNPAISGNRVVWEDFRNRGADILGYNLRTGKELAITTARAWQDTPAISGNIVVWRDARNAGNYDIYGKNLKTNKIMRITRNTSDQVSPAVSGRVVVWTDGRNGDTDIFGKDLSTNEEFPIMAGGDPQDSPAIDGETVVGEAQHTDEPNFGTWRIFGTDLDIAPAAPTGVTATVRPPRVTLKWNASPEPDLSGYNVYRSAAAGGPYTKLNTSGLLTTPAYSDRNAPATSIAYYRVTAVDGANNESAPATIRVAVP